MLLPVVTGSGASVLVTARSACASGVQVAPFTAGGAGAVVSTVIPPFAVTVPRVQTCTVPGGTTGVSIVAWNMMVTDSPAGRLNGPTLTMPADSGVIVAAVLLRRLFCVVIAARRSVGISSLLKEPSWIPNT